MAVVDQGWYECILQNPLCPLAQGDSQGQASLEPEVPTDTVFITKNLGPIQCTAYRLDSLITVSGGTVGAPVTWTFNVLLTSLWKGRIRVARGTCAIVSPSNTLQILQTWFSGPCPITERWIVTTTVSPDIDPGVGRASIKYNLVVGCVPIGSNTFYGEGVTSVPVGP